MQSKEMTKVFGYFSKHQQTTITKDWLKWKERILHNIGKLAIVDVSNEGATIVVINSESLHTLFFDSENDAMNYCLDIYDKIQLTKQSSMF